MFSQAPSPVAVSQPSAQEMLYQFCTGYMVSNALYVVSKLKIADLLAGGPRPVTELAEATGTLSDPLYRVLRMLAEVGIFREVGLRYFALTPTAEPLRSDAPGSLRDIVTWMTDPFHHRVYAEMMHSLQTGLPAIEKATGHKCFEYFEHDPEVCAEFNAAMTNFSAEMVPAVLEAYDFSGIGTLVDVAGGHGFALCAILVFYHRTDRSHRLQLASLALISSGAVGNLIDRIRWEHGVVDFIGPINLGVMFWPVFNVADSAITCGALLLAAALWRSERSSEPAPAPEPQRTN